MTPEGGWARRPGRGPVRRGALVLGLGLLLAGLPAAAGEQWGWLGVRIRDLTEQEMEEITAKLGLREGYGVLVAEVMPDTPAQAAGLRDGDLIVGIDARPIVETRTLQRVVGRTPPGQTLTLVVLRDRRRQAVPVRVGRMPPDAVAERVALEFGFFVRDAGTDEAGGRLPVVAGVAEGSPAARAGLRTGDRVVGVNDRDVTSLAEFRRIVQDLYLQDALRLRVERRGERLALTLPPAQPASYQ
jgi:serine protease Do